jgi:hypothetical protein
VFGFEEGHHRAKAFADVLDLMPAFRIPPAVEAGPTIAILGDPTVRVFAAFDVVEETAHFRFHFL